jgi:hypothetical protein
VQRNLFCKLGPSADKLTPIEEVLHEFITTLHGSMPLK